MNILLNSDSYKYTMHVQYPPGTEYVYSYIESRGGKYDQMLFFGLQGFIDEYLTKPITKYDIDEAEKYLFKHVGVFNREGWDYILEQHDGYLPIEIAAVPEGTVLPVKNCILTIVNTDPKCYWLTTFLETALLRAIWYPTTIATQGYYTKKKIKRYLDITSGFSDGLDYMLHDFGCRGVSSLESSMIGGVAHLVNFKGTDNVPALVYANKLYGCAMAGESVPAMEHSTVTSWGRENEFDSYNNMVDQYASFPIVSSVSDSYDIFEACHYVGKHLKDKIIANNQTYVIRPDSGDPEKVVVECLEILSGYFECKENLKGYKELSNVKILWGDGINHDSIEQIMYVVTMAGYSINNLVFGSGGALLQQMNRDTMKFAMKCSAICVNGKWVDVYKDPITDNVKKSKKGCVTLFHNPLNKPTYFTDVIDNPDRGSSNKIALDVVYRNGKRLVTHTLDDIRKRASK
jgi:nicotinamide phosphoribosyltransferase